MTQRINTAVKLLAVVAALGAASGASAQSKGEWLGKVGVVFDEPGVDGLFLWGRFPAHVDIRRLIEQAHDARIFLAPGSLFSNTRDYDQYIRLNVSHCNDIQFKRFIESQTCSETARRVTEHGV